MSVLTGLALGGCSSAPFKAYEGPDLGRDEIAIIKGTRQSGIRINILEVDNISTSRGDFNPAASSVIVLPGTHSLMVDLLNGGFLSHFWGVSDIWFDAEAGHTYIVMGAVKDGKVVLWVNDEKTGETIAGTRVQ